MRDFIGGVIAIIIGFCAVVAGLAFVGFVIALPFIAIGVGLGFIGWTFCLFVGFC